MPSLLESLLGRQPYVPGEFGQLMQLGLQNPAPHTADPGAIARARANISMGGDDPTVRGPFDMGYDSAGSAMSGQLSPAQRELPGGMVRSSNPWQPPMWGGGGSLMESLVESAPPTEVNFENAPGFREMSGGEWVPEDIFSKYAGSTNVMNQAKNSQMHDRVNARREELEGQLFPQTLDQENPAARPTEAAFREAMRNRPNPYLAGTPDSRALVMQNAQARNEGRMARMGEPSPMMMGLMQNGGGAGGAPGTMNPMLAGLLGGPSAFNGAIAGNANLAGNMAEYQANLLREQGEQRRHDASEAARQREHTERMAPITAATEQQKIQAARDPLVSAQDEINKLIPPETQITLEQYYENDQHDTTTPFSPSTWFDWGGDESFIEKASREFGIDQQLLRKWLALHQAKKTTKRPTV